jgi:hypothetical protein
LVHAAAAVEVADVLVHTNFEGYTVQQTKKTQRAIKSYRMPTGWTYVDALIANGMAVATLALVITAF